MSRRNGESRTPAPDGRPLAEQPLWRQDFPIDTPQYQYVARRDFTKFLGLISLAFAIGQGLQARDDEPFRYGEAGPFEYDLVRYFYLEHRRAEIAF